MTIHGDDVVIERVSPKGVIFSVEPVPQSGMWLVRMNRGGITPPFCDYKYTSRSRALKVLDDYLKDRNES